MMLYFMKLLQNLNRMLMKCLMNFLEIFSKEMMSKQINHSLLLNKMMIVGNGVV